MLQMSKGMITILVIRLLQGPPDGEHVFSHHPYICVPGRSDGTKLVGIEGPGNLYASFFPYLIHGFRVEGCFHEDGFDMGFLYEIHHFGSIRRTHPALFSGLPVQWSSNLEPEIAAKISERVMVGNQDSLGGRDLVDLFFYPTIEYFSSCR